MSSLQPPFPPQRSTFPAYDLIARARLFRRVAISLPDVEAPEPNWPKYFLLGHAIELALKAVPEHFRQSPTYAVPPGATVPANHDLLGQYEFAKLHGLQADPIINRDLPSLSELHKTHFARYPQTLRPVLLPSAYDDLTDKVIEQVEKVLGVRK
jgi:hypothetical protein